MKTAQALGAVRNTQSGSSNRERIRLARRARPLLSREHDAAGGLNAGARRLHQIEDVALHAVRRARRLAVECGRQGDARGSVRPRCV